MAIKRAIKAGNKSIISFKKAIKVGEITQLLDKNKLENTFTSNNLTFTNNGNGSVTVTGTVVDGIAKNIYSISNLKELIKGHKYLLSGCPEDGDSWTYMLRLNVYNPNNCGWEDHGTGHIFTFDMEYYDRDVGGIYIYEREVGAEVNRTYIPQLFDLTEMFGAGHEPATVAEFKAKFPEAYYPYQRAVLTVYNKVVRPCARKGEVVQLLNKSTYYNTQTNVGITATNNGDGSWTINGTATKTDFVNFSPELSLDNGHKVLLTGNKIHSGFSFELFNQDIADYGNGTIGRIKAGRSRRWGIAWSSGAVINNVTITPQLFDLTAMYGAGNEPKTLADFRKDFPESYYPYNPIQTKNLFDIRKVSGLISRHLNNESASFFIKNLAQNSLQIKIGAYGIYDYLREPIILPAGTYTFSCDCNYDAIYNRGGVHLNVGKKSEDNTRIISIREGDFNPIHRLILTFTLAEETEVYLSLQGDGGPANYTNLNNVFFNIQLEKGSVATDYVPHDYI